jgi:predicted nuclease with RNAse H fold
MKTLGIDLAADPKKTAAATIEWTPEAARLVHLELGVTDEAIVGLFAGTDSTGIDCPLGWPQALVPFLLGHAGGNADAVLRHDGIAGRRLLAYRDTDRFVTGKTGLIPLSVSADRLAHPAMRCAVIQAKIANASSSQPLDGSGKLAEVYPAASLKLWGIAAKKYKGTGAAEVEVRRGVLRQLRAAAPWLDLAGYADELMASDDLFDAVMASLTARAAATGRTFRPDAAEKAIALREGWIHLPSGPLEDLPTDGGTA